jgi:hypothetical protein
VVTVTVTWYRPHLDTPERIQQGSWSSRSRNLCVCGGGELVQMEVTRGVSQLVTELTNFGSMPLSTLASNVGDIHRRIGGGGDEVRPRASPHAG